MANECLATPDWAALEAEEQATGQSIDPTSFFGCDPSATPVEPMPMDAGPPMSIDPLMSFDPGPPMSVAPDVSGLEHWAEDDAGMCVDPSQQVCEDPSQMVCEAPAAEAAPAPPRLGVDAYDVVPDDFVGPLGPNQIHASQRATLDRYNFGGLNVVADDFTGPLQRGQMHQSDYTQLQSSWLNITSGTGMHMAGSAADQEAFLQMMRADLGESSTFQRTVSEIGNDTDPAHRVELDLGRGQDITGAPGTGVWGDAFATDQVDLDDFGFFPAAPDAARPNEITQTELMTHFLAERRAALTSATPADFGPAHTAGLAVQNQVRDEFNQSHVVSQTGAANAAGGTDGVFTFADGTSERVNTDVHNNMTGRVGP